MICKYNSHIIGTGKSSFFVPFVSIGPLIGVFVVSGLGSNLDTYTVKSKSAEDSLQDLMFGLIRLYWICNQDQHQNMFSRSVQHKIIT